VKLLGISGAGRPSAFRWPSFLVESTMDLSSAGENQCHRSLTAYYVPWLKIGDLSESDFRSNGSRALLLVDSVLDE
jgi:hypothetical protein